MTAQFAEKLRYQGEQVAMFTNPLSDYFKLAGLNPGFESKCTALWRGYVGKWEIVDDRLYLIGLNAALENGSQATLDTFFPGFPDRVFAHWYSGSVRIPQGERLRYVHMGYGSVFERDLFLDIERGVVVTTRIRENGVAESELAPEGSSAEPMAVFTRGRVDEKGGE